MKSALLAKIYSTSPQLKQELSYFADEDLAAEIAKHRLSTWPLLHDFPMGLTFLRSLGLHEIISLASCSIWRSAYERVSRRDILAVQKLTERIGQQKRWPFELRAFLLHSLLAHTVAYRSEKALTSDLIFTLPIWREGCCYLEPCRLSRYIDVGGGALTRIFVPLSGKGSPTYLFHGTLCWNQASAAGLTIIDDFNPLGIGEQIRRSARKRLAGELSRDQELYGEKAIILGQSLGGVLATALTVDLPSLVQFSLSFSSPRSSSRLKRRWQKISSPPPIYHFIGRFSGRADPVTWFGEEWIGEVYEIEERRALLGHIWPLGLTLYFSLSFKETQRSTLIWRIAQKIAASAIFSILHPLFLLKRLLFGWQEGGVWRGGAIGAALHYLKRSKKPLVRLFSRLFSTGE